ncbi:hypothetical protein GYH30_011570 [Glycine max]|nr:hypothetical protein GYH30_011570 [Glycine max]
MNKSSIIASPPSQPFPYTTTVPPRATIVVPPSCNHCLGTFLVQPPLSLEPLSRTLPRTTTIVTP